MHMPKHTNVAPTSGDQWDFQVRSARGHHDTPNVHHLFKGDVEAIEAGVSEGGQNTKDAQLPGSSAPARLSLSLANVGRDVLRRMFGPSAAHWTASGIDIERLIEEEEPVVLLMEDYNTTGLTGPIHGTEAKEGGFPALMRWSGESSKDDSFGGRYGLGKTALLSCSRARTFVVSTIREGGDGPYVIGKAMLKAHQIGETRHVAWGFFFRDLYNGIGPEMPFAGDQASAIAESLGSRRGDRTGTSFMMPWPVAGVTEETLMRAAVGRFFHQIARGSLEIEVCGTLLDTTTVVEHATRLFRPEHPIHQRLRGSMLLGDPTAPVVLIECTGKSREELLPGDVSDLPAVKEFFKAGTPFVARVCLPIEGCSGGADLEFAIFPEVGEADAELRKPFFGRSGVSVVLPYWAMSRGFAVGEVRSRRALSFFAKCENPAHTKWAKSDAPSQPVFMQAVTMAKRLEELCAPPRDEISIMSRMTRMFTVKIPPKLLEVERSRNPGRAGGNRGTGASGPGINHPAQVPEIKDSGPRPQQTGVDYAFEGGTLEVRGTADAGTVVDLELGYKVNKLKNGVRKHSVLDFDLDREERHTITVSGASLVVTSPNTLRVAFRGGPVSIAITGFDPNRALDYVARDVTQEVSDHE